MRMFKIINIDSKKDMGGVKDIIDGGSVTLGFRDRVLRIALFTNNCSYTWSSWMSSLVWHNISVCVHQEWPTQLGIEGFSLLNLGETALLKSTQCKMLVNRIYFNLQWSCIWMRKNRMLPSRNSLMKYDVAHTRGVASFPQSTWHPRPAYRFLSLRSAFRLVYDCKANRCHMQLTLSST